MRLAVRHQTAYHYELPIAAAAQVLRLSPRPYQGLIVHSWSVRAGHRNLRSFIDGFGNITHCHYVNAPHGEGVISVEGEVETVNTHGIVRGASEPLPPAFFLRRTELTRADAAIADLARSVPSTLSVLKQLHALLNAVRDRV